MALTIRTCVVVAACIVAPWSLPAQTDSSVVARNDSITARLVNVDLRLAIQALGRYLDRPVVFGNIGEVRVTLETPQPVPRARLPELLRGLLKTYGLMLAEQPGFFSVEPIAQAVPQGQAQTGAGPVQLFVIHIRHARAADVAATVNALYGRGGALGEAGGGTRPTLAQGLRDNLVPPAGAPQPAQQQQPLTTQTAQLSGDVTIIPDARTNSLLIRASRMDFDLIRAAVEQLDVRPLQVLIQVIIAEVRRDRSFSYGLEALFDSVPVRGSNAKVSGSTRGLGASDFVLKVMHLGGADMTATLSAAASRGDVTILSRPVVLAANNESAEILVGSQRPFIQVQRALPTDNAARDQVVQFKDVGTRLTVRPTISDDGYVTLRVAQEVNAATAEVAFDAPVISTRTIETQLLVKDRQTAVLGGLTDRQKEETRAGVPILSSLPLIGGLFGRLVKRTTETELFVFLSPRVIRNDEDLQNASDSVGERTQHLREEATQTSAAQDGRARSARWSGFGLGWGSYSITCGGCVAVDRQGSISGYVKAGVTFRPQLLLGGEINGWTKSANGSTLTAANVSLAAYSYPWVTSGVFLRGGMGLSATRSRSGGRTRIQTGPGATLGVGYDVRVTPNTSLTPVVNLLWVRPGSGGSHRFIQFALGVTFR